MEHGNNKQKTNIIIAILFSPLSLIVYTVMFVHYRKRIAAYLLAAVFTLIVAFNVYETVTTYAIEETYETEVVINTYEYVERDIEFVRYDARGMFSRWSYIDVIMIWKWFSYESYNPGGTIGGSNALITHNTVYMVIDDSFEVGFIRVVGNNPLSFFCDILSEAVDTDEFVIPAQRLYGVTALMANDGVRWVPTLLDEDGELQASAGQIDEIFETIDGRRILDLTNVTTRTEREIAHTETEIVENARIITNSVSEYHPIRVVIMGTISLLFVAAYAVNMFKAKKTMKNLGKMKL